MKHKPKYNLQHSLNSMLSCFFMIFALVGCTTNEPREDDSLTQQTTVAAKNTSIVTSNLATSISQPSQASLPIQTSRSPIDAKYQNILFHPDFYQEADYREPDFFTPYSTKPEGSCHSEVPFDVLIAEYADLFARVKITKNHAGFNVYERWYDDQANRSTVWSSYEAKIVDVYFGEEEEGNQIELFRLGGIFEDTLQDFGFFEELEEGAEYLVIVMDMKNHPSTEIAQSSSELSSYIIYSPHDSYFKIDHENIMINKQFVPFAHFRSNIDVSMIIQYTMDVYKQAD